MSSESKVVSIYGDDFDPRKASDRVIEVLERQLEKARAGEIIGVALAVTYFDQSSGHEFTGIQPNSLIGAVARLQHELLR